VLLRASQAWKNTHKKNTMNSYEAVATRKSNARLIASALEDAEFLLRKDSRMAGPMQCSFRRSAEDARAAIAKAKAKGEA